MKTAAELILDRHAQFARQTTTARRNFAAAAALRPDLREAREREIAAAQADAFATFRRDLAALLEAQRERVRELRPAARLVRALLEKTDRRERAATARDMLRAAPLAMLLDMAREATRQQDIGTLAGITQVLDGRAADHDPTDPAVRALRAELERWAVGDYNDARAALLLAQGLAARALTAGAWQDAPAALMADPSAVVGAMREARHVEAEAVDAPPFSLHELELLTGRLPHPDGLWPDADEYDAAQARERLGEAILGTLPASTGDARAHAA